MTDWLLIPIGAGCSIAGVALLYRSWARQPRGSVVMVAAGWLMLVVAAAAWIFLDGWEFGMIYAITVPALPAGAVLWLCADRRSGRVPSMARLSLSMPGRNAVRASLLTFLLVVPFGVATSILVTSAAGLLLPLGELNQLVFIVCVMPVVWGVLAVWLTMDERRTRTVLSLVVLSGASLLTILAR